MSRPPRATPKKPGPYRARQPNNVYTPPPPRAPFQPYNAAETPAAVRSTQRKTRMIRGSKGIGIYVMATCAFGMAFYGSSLYVSFSRCSEQHGNHSPAAQKDVSAVYDQTADGFDTEVGFSEWVGGINKARQQMAAGAEGDVLEVSAGTARNLGYYKFPKIKSLTLVDLSQQMVEQGRKKWDILNPGKAAEGVPVRFLQGDCCGDMPGPPAETQEVAKNGTTFTPGLKKGYDTIVQTMGVCSTPSPTQLLQNLSRHLNHSNPNARILLLEHGRSYYDWMNKILDVHASEHADKHGCWWNRDIGKIVEESGLEIVKERRKHFGTTWMFELKPKSVTESIKEKAEQIEEKVQERFQEQTPQQGWLSWMSK